MTTQQAIRQTLLANLGLTEQRIVEYMQAAYRKNEQDDNDTLSYSQCKPYGVKPHHMEGAFDKLQKKGLVIRHAHSVTKTRKVYYDDKGNHLSPPRDEEYQQEYSRYSLSPLLRETQEDYIRMAEKDLADREAKLAQHQDDLAVSYTKLIQVRQALTIALRVLPADAIHDHADDVKTAQNHAATFRHQADNVYYAQRQIETDKTSIKALKARVRKLKSKLTDGS